MSVHTRREMLGGSLAGLLGWALTPSVARLLAQDASAPVAKAKSSILVWLNGGPSHIDTFDPKPGAPTNGPFAAIDTAVAGVQFSEHLPKLAQQADKLAVVRSLTSVEADHDRAYYFLHTGNQLQPTAEFPSLGAVMAQTRSTEEAALPSFVTIGSSGNGDGGGFLGLEYNPYVVADLANPIANITSPEAVREPRLARRLEALRRFDGRFAGSVPQSTVQDYGRFADKALNVMRGPGLAAFDLTQESPETLARYGAEAEDAYFQRACVTARRLVEHGVRFVEVVLDGWDTHADNFNQVTALCGQLDPALSGLIADLSDRDLLDQTLVLCMGEFGRTPTINGDNGRDHWSDSFSAMLAGGGIRGGVVLGKSDEKGEQPAERPVTIPDLYATLLTTCGVDPRHQFRTREGRPIRLADKGTAVAELL
jgi:uncharacterized protein (DUF1501 family)